MPSFDHTAPFIWSAYGLAAAVILFATISVIVRASRAKRRLDALERDTGSWS